MKIKHQKRYLGVNNILKYLNKELKKYTELSEKLQYMYENERDGHPVDMYEDDRYIEYSVKINYLSKLIKKLKRKTRRNDANIKSIIRI